MRTDSVGWLALFWTLIVLVGSDPAAAQTDEVTVTAAKDSFVWLGGMNRNEGANPRLFMAAEARHRVVVGFDLSEVDINNVTEAALVLTIAENVQLNRQRGCTNESRSRREPRGARIAHDV